jgi:hypothetical protein
MEPIDFPRHLDVRRVPDVEEIGGGEAFHGPFLPAPVILLPVDGIAKVDFSRSESLENVSKNILSVAQDFLLRLRLREQVKKEVFSVSRVEEESEACRFVEILKKSITVLPKRKEGAELAIRQLLGLLPAVQAPNGGLDQSINNSPGMDFHHAGMRFI